MWLTKINESSHLCVVFVSVCCVCECVWFIRVEVVILPMELCWYLFVKLSWWCYLVLSKFSCHKHKKKIRYLNLPFSSCRSNSAYVSSCVRYAFVTLTCIHLKSSKNMHACWLLWVFFDLDLTCFLSFVWVVCEIIMLLFFWLHTFTWNL